MIAVQEQTDSLRQRETWSYRRQAGDRAVIKSISETPFLIGRASACDLAVENPTVSTRHAEFDVISDELIVTDLGSTNGTFINGNRITRPTKVMSGDVIHFGREMLVISRCGDVRGGEATVPTDGVGEVLGEANFERLLTATGAMYSKFQPIILLETGETVAYEALVRSSLPGLKSPAEMFRIAALRSEADTLSECARLEAVTRFSASIVDTELFLNAHPTELFRGRLIPSLAHLRIQYPDLPVVLEVPESASLSVEQLRKLHADLKALKIRMAYDDFGAGQARVIELAEVPPEIVKFDIRVIQRLPDASKATRDAIARLVDLVCDLGSMPLAEGIETAEQADICRDLGFVCGQGFYHGHPEAIE